MLKFINKAEIRLLLIAVPITLIGMAINFQNTGYDSDHYYVVKLAQDKSLQGLHTAQMEWVNIITAQFGTKIYYLLDTVISINPLVAGYLQLFLHSILMVLFMKRILERFGVEETTAALCSLFFLTLNPLGGFSYGYIFLYNFRANTGLSFLRLYPIFFYAILLRKDLLFSVIFGYVLLFHPVHAAIMAFVYINYAVVKYFSEKDKRSLLYSVSYLIMLFLYYYQFAGQSAPIDSNLWLKLANLWPDSSLFPWRFYYNLFLFLSTALLCGLLTWSIRGHIGKTLVAFCMVVIASSLILASVSYASYFIFFSPNILGLILSRGSALVYFLFYMILCVWGFLHTYPDRKEMLWWLMAGFVVLNYYNTFAIIAYCLLLFFLIRFNFSLVATISFCFLLYLASAFYIHPYTNKMVFRIITDREFLLVFSGVFFILSFLYPRLNRKLFVLLCCIVILKYGVYSGRAWWQIHSLNAPKLFEIVNYLKEHGRGKLILYGEDGKSDILGVIANSGIPILLNNVYIRGSVIYYTRGLPTVVKECKIVYKFDLSKDSISGTQNYNFLHYMQRALQNMDAVHLLSIKKEYPALKYLVFPSHWALNKDLPVKLVYSNSLGSIYEIVDD